MASSFSRQRNPNMEKALFDWPIVLQYDVKAISRKFFGHEVCLPERSLSQPKPRCVCIRFIHQSNRSISVRLLFLFCSRVFISRSYENRSILPLFFKRRSPTFSLLKKKKKRTPDHRLLILRLFAKTGNSNFCAVLNS